MDKDINQARQAVEQAKAAAEHRRDVTSKLAEAWRESRNDNNFRLMLRRLGLRGFA